MEERFCQAEGLDISISTQDEPLLSQFSMSHVKQGEEHSQSTLNFKVGEASKVMHALLPPLP